MSLTSFLHDCPACGYLADIRATRPQDSDDPALNDIILCGSCGHISILVAFVQSSESTSAVFRPMTDVEYATMPEDVRKEIDFAVRNIKAAKKKQK